MTDTRNSHLEGAIQALVWAIEDIAKTGNTNAERHARLALKYLRDRPTKASSHTRSTK
jgi:hypothetical protein